MQRTIVQPPVLGSAALAELKHWLGINRPDEDDALMRLLETSLATCEAFTGQTPLRQTVEEIVPLDASWRELVSRPVQAVVSAELIAEDGSRTNIADITGLANGANRMMIGSEAIQFVRAIPLGGRRWRLQGLLRGRGGTEPEAAIGHLAQTGVVLLDDSLVPLDAAEVPALDSTSIAAIGTSDNDAVIAYLANAGLSRRPLTPVHPRLQVGTDAVWDICWTRRARGQWRWDDGVDVPLIEELEAYLVGYGPIGAPYAAWSVDAPRIAFTQKQRTVLLDAWGPSELWVRQLGTFGQSPPLLIAPLS